MRGEMHSPADAPPEPVRDFDWWRSRVGFFLGPLLAAVVLLIPMPNLSPEAHRLAAILALTIIYWMTEAIPMAATALLGRGPEACDEALEELGRAGLVDLRDARTGTDARIRLSELQRAHARRRARQDLAADESERARARVLRWFWTWLLQGQEKGGSHLIVAFSNYVTCCFVPPSNGNIPVGCFGFLSAR